MKKIYVEESDFNQIYFIQLKNFSLCEMEFVGIYKVIFSWAVRIVYFWLIFTGIHFFSVDFGYVLKINFQSYDT